MMPSEEDTNVPPLGPQPSGDQPELCTRRGVLDGTESFAAIVRDHQRMLEVRAKRLCRDRELAMDLVQDTLERALRHYPDLEPSAALRPWLLAILGNLFIDEIRRKRSAIEIALGPEHDIPVARPDLSHTEWMVSLERVRTAVAKLEPELREIVEMHCFRKLRYRDIAQRLSIPSGTVRTRLARARERLRTLLTDDVAPEEAAG